MSLLQGPLVHFGHSFQFWLEVLPDFFFCNTANGSIFWKETDIGQVVEYREKRNLRKLGDARNEDETLVRIICFQDGKNLTIYLGAVFVMRCLPRVLERRIVFIDENGNFLTGLFVCFRDNCIKSVCEFGSWICYDGIHLLVFLESLVQVRTKRASIGSPSAHVESNNRVLFPFLLQLHDFQSFEELFSSFEVSLECINKHRLTESARTAQVIIL